MPELAAGPQAAAMIAPVQIGADAVIHAASIQAGGAIAAILGAVVAGELIDSGRWSAPRLKGN